MDPRDKRDDRAQIHIAAVFHKDEMDQYDQGSVREYLEVMLEDEDILHGTVLVMEPEGNKTTVQTRLHKASMSMDVAETIDEIYSAMSGHIETWILTESAMYHPEIYK